MALSGGISNSDLVDLQRTTLENLPDLEFEVALENQTYIVINQWFTKEKMEVGSGTSIARNITLDSSGNAQHVRLYQKQTLNVGDVQSRLTVPWVQATASYSIERREALRNRKPAMYISLIKSRRIDAMKALANLFELRGFLSPESTSDDLNPYGLPYWVNKVIPSGGTGYSSTIDKAGTFCGRRIIFGQTSAPTYVNNNKAGINPTASPLFRNYADLYKAIDPNFVVKLRKAFHATHFQSPITIQQMLKGPMSRYAIYMNLSTIVSYEDLVTKQNDNLGKDADTFHGQTTFKRVPVHYANQLDLDDPNNNSWGSNPVYGINHDKFHPMVMDGDWMRESDPMSDVEQHNVVSTFVDCSYQYICTNVREGGFVLHLALSA